ncbi:MAG TPA: glycosyltransferase family 39 protein, partial [Isosphaeraceae bacterium]|nr:glycosyltransferase family 39 protein [Isosphaeraceae bacterium]
IVALLSAVSLGGNTDLNAPPRFDGAGYAVLGEALATGRGYREIDRPEPTWHAHFPPGYPAILAALWRITGRSVAPAHLVSGACTVVATLAAWIWFRRLYSPRIALVLGLALAVNWTWGRTGGAIQSEPLYFLLGQLAILAVARAGRRSGAGPGVISGLLLGATVLTRHVGACLALAAVLDLMTRRRWRTALSAGLVATLLVLPWVGWLATVGRDTQAEILARGGLAERVARQAVFYLRRPPDQVTGPLVEIGTVFRSSTSGTALVNLWATLATGLLVFGWMRALRSPRRRLAGLVASTTLGLLLVWPFTEAGRFLIPLVPHLLVGAVEGLAPLAVLAKLRRPRVWAAGAVLAASLPYAIYALATGRAEAQRQTFRDFDAACAWISREAVQPGPVLTRHPGEVFWLTRRPALSPSTDEPEAIDRLIDRFGVAYLLIDNGRYANSPANPLSRYVARRPHRVRQVWKITTGRASVALYEVRRKKGDVPRSSKQPLAGEISPP